MSILKCCLQGESVMSDETLTGNEEPNTPYLLNLEDDEERPDSTARNTARSTLERYCQHDLWLPDIA